MPYRVAFGYDEDSPDAPLNWSCFYGTYKQANALANLLIVNAGFAWSEVWEEPSGSLRAAPSGDMSSAPPARDGPRYRP